MGSVGADPACFERALHRLEHDPAIRRALPDDMSRLYAKF
jgi:hypothetical protein